MSFSPTLGITDTNTSQLPRKRKLYCLPFLQLHELLLSCLRNIYSPSPQPHPQVELDRNINRFNVDRYFTASLFFFFVPAHNMYIRV